MSTIVGQQLRQAREERSLTLEQVAQATRVRVHYLQAMEAGQFESLPSIVQVRGFLRAYAGFLGLDAEALLAALNEEEITSPAVSQPPAPKTPQTPDYTPEADSYFVEIGQQLQRQRELLGLSLDDVERHTHLRRHYLQALETGDLQALPSPVQGRGMLNNYAAFLGLDSEPLLLRFADGLQAGLAARRSKRPQPRTTPQRKGPSLPSPLRRLFSTDILIGVTIMAALTAFVVWGAIRIFAIQSDQTPTPTAPSIVDVLLASPTATPIPTMPPATPTNPSAPLAPPTQALVTDAEGGAPIPADLPEGVQVYISVHQRSWLRAIVDGEIEFEGRVLPGSAYTFAGEDQIEILAGNGAALQAYFNGQDLGLMGDFGEVVNQVFVAGGVLTPTPTATQTPTNTLPAPPTPVPTATPRPGEATVPPNP